MQISSKIKA